MTEDRRATGVLRAPPSEKSFTVADAYGLAEGAEIGVKADVIRRYRVVNGAEVPLRRSALRERLAEAGLTAADLAASTSLPVALIEKLIEGAEPTDGASESIVAALGLGLGDVWPVDDGSEAEAPAAEPAKSGRAARKKRK